MDRREPGGPTDNDADLPARGSSDPEAITEHCGACGRPAPGISPSPPPMKWFVIGPISLNAPPMSEESPSNE
jgi:hypothetical protein